MRIAGAQAQTPASIGNAHAGLGLATAIGGIHRTLMEQTTMAPGAIDQADDAPV
jgi:hypothetical protein